MRLVAVSVVSVSRIPLVSEAKARESEVSEDEQGEYGGSSACHAVRVVSTIYRQKRSWVS